MSLELPAFEYALARALEKDKLLFKPNPDRNTTPPENMDMKNVIVNHILKDEDVFMKSESSEDNHEAIVVEQPLDKEEPKSLPTDAYKIKDSQ